MKIIVFVLGLFFSFVFPVFSEDDSMFLIYSYSPNDRSVKSHPAKKAKKKPSIRSTSKDWTVTKSEEEPFDWGDMPTISLRSTMVDKFMMGNGQVSYGKSVIQSDVSAIFKSGFYIDVWNSTPVKKNKERLGSELDYNIGWTGSLIGQTIIDIGATYCDLPTFGRIGAVDDVFYSYVKLSRSIGGFNIYGAAENNSTTPKSSYKGGSLYSVGISRSDSYLDRDLTLDMSLEPVYDTGGFDLTSGMFLRGKIGFNWNVEKNLIVVFPQVNYYVPLTVHDIRTSGTTITSGFVYQF